MDVLSFVTCSGKTNRSGRHVRSGCLADINPLLCAWFALAYLFLFRWLVEKEEPPSWADGEYASLFNIPILRSPLDLKKPMPAETHGALCGDFLTFFGVATLKLTHFFRGNTARVLERESVCPRLVEKFMNRVNNLIAASYGGHPTDAGNSPPCVRREVFDGNGAK